MKDFTDENGCFWPTEENKPGVYGWYFMEIIGCCGCYNDELFEDIVKTILAFDGKNPYITELPIEGPDKYKEFILHIMTDKGLLEHGTAVRASWLTSKGKEILEKIKDNS